MSEEQLLFDAFIRGKLGTISNNFDFAPLIDEFKKDGFYTLISNLNDEELENGAYLFITGKQYILTLNVDYGQGTHALTASRLYSTLTNTKYITKFDNISKIANKLEQFPSCFYARIYYDSISDNARLKPKYSGSINFPLENRKFNSGEIESFLQFYNDYSEEIKSICKKYKMNVFFTYTLDDGTKCHNESYDLENLKDYILSNRDDSLEDYFENLGIEEKIIGTQTNINKLKK